MPAFCVYMDITKDLPEGINLCWDDEDWFQLLDYEHYPSDASVVMNMDTCSKNVLKTTQQSSRKANKLKMRPTLPKFQAKK